MFNKVPETNLSVSIFETTQMFWRNVNYLINQMD